MVKYISLLLTLLLVVGCNAAPKLDFTPLIAIELGLYSTTTPQDEAVHKVPRSECTHCNGTGKIKTGDGLAWEPCPYCEGPSPDDDDESSTGNFTQKAPPDDLANSVKELSEKLESKDVELAAQQSEMEENAKRVAVLEKAMKKIYAKINKPAAPVVAESPPVEKSSEVSDNSNLANGVISDVEKMTAPVESVPISVREQLECGKLKWHTLNGKCCPECDCDPCYCSYRGECKVREQMGKHAVVWHGNQGFIYYAPHGDKEATFDKIWRADSNTQQAAPQIKAPANYQYQYRRRSSCGPGGCG